MQFQALETIVNGEVQRGTKVKAFVSFFAFRKLRKVRGVMGKLEGKVAVITGASKGIGEGIAKVYAKYGAKCVLAARGPKVLELAEQLKSEGYEATGVQVDVSDYKSVERIVEVAEKHMERSMCLYVTQVYVFLKTFLKMTHLKIGTYILILMSKVHGMWQKLLFQA